MFDRIERDRVERRSARSMDVITAWSDSLSIWSPISRIVIDDERCRPRGWATVEASKHGSPNAEFSSGRGSAEIKVVALDPWAGRAVVRRRNDRCRTFRPFEHAGRRIKAWERRRFHCLLSLASSGLGCLGIRLVKRPCCCCVGRIVAGGNPRSLARRGRLSRLLQFKHNGGYLYRFQNKNDKRTKREWAESKMGVKGKARRRKRVIARDGKESLSKGTNENERERERERERGRILGVRERKR